MRGVGLVRCDPLQGQGGLMPDAKTWTAEIGGVSVRVWASERSLAVEFGPPGNPLEQTLSAICRAAEIGMARDRVPMAAYLRQFRGTRFEPSGPTQDPWAPHCSSILDYVARSVEARLGRSRNSPG